MIRKIITLMFVIFMVSSVAMIPHVANTSTLDYTPEVSHQVAETDLSRVTLEADVAPNDGFEDWTTPYYPEDVYTSRTTEGATWISTTIVNEGSQSVGMSARSINGIIPSQVRLTQQAWVYWNNPVNARIDLDWYIDEIGTPLNADYFSMQVQMSGRSIYYYLGCQATFPNSTYIGNININGPLQTWNHLHRNLTSDFIEIFSLVPAQFQLIYWWVYAETTEYTRVYMDDVRLVNGTYVHVGGSTLNGNFEGGGGWTFQSDNDPADVSQSSKSHSGAWSMNMTSISYDDVSRAYATIYPDKRLSLENQGNLSFYWYIDDWVNPNTNSRALVRVSVSNTTNSLTMYYYLCVGGDGKAPVIIFSDDIKLGVDSFNVTDTWNLFDHNIWQDYNSRYHTQDLYVESVSIEVYGNGGNSRLSVLIDDLEFTSALITDMDYETQGAIGTPIEGWTEPDSYDTFTVTDFAANGDKAGNLTLEHNEYFSENQEFGDLAIDATTELILDFNVYLDLFNQSSEDFLVFEFGLGNGEGLTYVIANSSSEFEGWVSEESNVIFLQDTIITGDWMNFQLDLVHDYESLVGSLPDTTLEYVYLMAWAEKSSKLTAFLDDLYLYYDSAPEISGVSHEPLNPNPNDFVEVSATVVDATLESVVLNYRVDNGTWMTQMMSQRDNAQFWTNFTDLAVGAFIEYYVTATDAFGKTSDALNDGQYFSFMVEPVGGFPLAPIVAVVVIAAVGVVILLYMFVYKNKE